MIIRKRHSQRFKRGRLVNIMAGASFIVAAATWLVFNDQRRRAGIAIRNTVMQWPLPTKSFISRAWQWLRDLIIDPWGRYRPRVLQGVRGDVLEVGTGDWPNLRYYTAGEMRLTGTEKNRRIILSARRRVRRLQQNAQVVHSRPEHLPFHDQSFDMVVLSLSLCRVKNQAKALAEISRVLRPGGEIHFLEHTRTTVTAAALLHDILAPIWHVFNGCVSNHDPLESLQEAGFEVITVETIQNVWRPIRPTVCGVARKVADTTTAFAGAGK